eukprot:SAG11_NODE_1923_length_4060_cov_4.514012_3_plen_253_part_00
MRESNNSSPTSSQRYRFWCTFDRVDASRARRNGLATHPHLSTVDQISSFAVFDPTNDTAPIEHKSICKTTTKNAAMMNQEAVFSHSLVGCHHIQRVSCAANHAGHIVEHVVALSLCLEEFYVRVEKVTFRRMDACVIRSFGKNTHSPPRCTGLVQSRPWHTPFLHSSCTSCMTLVVIAAFLYKRLWYVRRETTIAQTASNDNAQMLDRPDGAWIAKDPIRSLVCHESHRESSEEFPRAEHISSAMQSAEEYL